MVNLFFIQKIYLVVALVLSSSSRNYDDKSIVIAVIAAPIYILSLLAC